MSRQPSDSQSRKWKIRLGLSVVMALTTGTLAVAGTNVCGEITQDTTWNLAGSPYTLTCGVSVRSGVTLTIEPNVEVKHPSENYGLTVYGRLVATDASITGAYSFPFQVESGGRADLIHCTFTYCRLFFRSNSQGTVSNCTGRPTVLVWSSPTIEYNDLTQIQFNTGVPIVRYNTINSWLPLSLYDPDASLAGVSGNTFTASNPLIEITGVLNSVQTLGIVNGLHTYTLPPYLSQGLRVEAGAQLTVAAGVEVQVPNVNYGIQIAGSFQATDASITGAYSFPIQVESGGRADLIHCTFTYCRLFFYSNSQGTVSNCTGRPTVLVWSSPTIEYNDLTQIQFNTGVPIVRYNTINSWLPLSLYDPDASLAGVSGNTFTASNPLIEITGVLNSVQTLGIVNGLHTYTLPPYLSQGLRVEAGAQLTVAAGVEVQVPNVNYGIQIAGSFQANKASITGAYSFPIQVESGGRADLIHCTFTYCRLFFYSNSQGTVSNCTGRPTVLVWSSPTIEYSDLTQVQFNTGVPIVRYNTINSSLPLSLYDPDASLAGVSGNTYAASNPLIEITGSLNGVRTLGIVDGLHIYTLPPYLYQGLRVEAGAQLTVASGVEVQVPNVNYSFQIAGSLQANGTSFTGAYNFPIQVDSGGEANLKNCSISNNGRLLYNNGSKGKITYSVLSQLFLNNIPSNMKIDHNDLSGGCVTTTGNPSAVFNMQKNWWGSTSDTQIDARITDHEDDPARPLVDHSLPLALASPGPDLAGVVKNEQTGGPIPEAQVSVNNQAAVLTDEDGQFSFDDLDLSGEVTVTATREGYASGSTPAIVGNTQVPIFLAPKVDFGVYQVASRFSGGGTWAYYLADVSLSETFTATVNWGTRTPGKVKWITPKQTYETPCTGETVTLTLDVGTDFEAGESMEVVAVDGDGSQQSPSKNAPFDVIETPAGIPSWFFHVKNNQRPLVYIPLDPDDPLGMVPVYEGTLTDDSGIPIPADIPFMGNSPLNFGGQGEMDVSINGSDGTFSAVITPDLEDQKTEVGGVEFAPSVSGSLHAHYTKGTGWGKVGGSTTVGIGASAGWSYPVPAFPLIFFEVNAGLDASFTVGVEDWLLNPDNSSDATVNFNATVEPWIEGAVGVGINDVACLEAYGKGGATFQFDVPGQPGACWGALSSLGLFVEAGARYKFLMYEDTIFKHRWTYDVCGRSRNDEELDSDQFEVEGFRHDSSKPTSSPRLTSRDYLQAKGYARFAANDTPVEKEPDDSYKNGSSSGEGPGVEVCSSISRPGTVETPFECTVFPLSLPQLACLKSAGQPTKDLLLVWIKDDDQRTSTNRTSLHYSKYNGTAKSWGSPAAIQNDGTADGNSDIAALPNGDSIGAWENANGVLIEPGAEGDPCKLTCVTECQNPESNECKNCLDSCKFLELKSKLEISVSTFHAGSWGTPLRLTTNTHLDRGPKLAFSSDGKAMLVWVSNEGNDFSGNALFPNDIHFTRYDGATWSSPGIVAAGVPSLLKSDLAWDGTSATFVYSADTNLDDTQDNVDDYDLYLVRYNEGVWGTVQRLTNDSVQDQNPQLTYAPDNTLLLLWRSGENIQMAELEPDGTLSDRRTVVEGKNLHSMGLSDFRLAQGASGQIGLAWQSSSNVQGAISDMWFAIYDPNLETWSKGMELTFDDSTERSMSPVFDLEGDLNIAYNKVETVDTPKTVVIGGREISYDMPGDGTAHLYTVRHTIRYDLAVYSSGVTFTPPNPTAGETVAISAEVWNNGDVPVQHILVRYYDGDPAAGGAVIGDATADGTLVGGGSVVVTYPSWQPSLSRQSHNIYIVVDPEQQYADRDRSNNTAVASGVMKADLAIESILVQSAGLDRTVTIRLKNTSGLAVKGATLNLRQDSATGLLLASFRIANSLEPGQSYDFSWTWTNFAECTNGIEILAIADEWGQIDEFDETNNIGVAILTCDEPILLTMTKGTGNNLHLSWTGGKPPYLVERASKPDFSNKVTLATGLQTASYDDPVLNDGKTWFYLVHRSK